MSTWVPRLRVVAASCAVLGLLATGTIGCADWTGEGRHESSLGYGPEDVTAETWMDFEFMFRRDADTETLRDVPCAVLPTGRLSFRTNQEIGDELAVELGDATCLALSELVDARDRLARIGAGQASTLEVSRFELWFGSATVPALEIDIPKIDANLKQMVSGIAEDPLIFVGLPDDFREIYCTGAEARSFKNDADRQLVTCRPLASGDIAARVRLIVHEAAHIYAGLPDHGYGGPCVHHINERGQTRAWTLTPEELVDNPDTIARWLVDEPSFTSLVLYSHPERQADACFSELPGEYLTELERPRF